MAAAMATAEAETQALEKQEEGQAAGKQEEGQAAGKQEEGQVAGKQEEGLVAAKQEEGALVHGQTDKVVGEKVHTVRKQVAAQSCFLIFSIASAVLCILVFTTFAEEGCESNPISLKMWFLVVGIVTLVAVLAVCKMLHGLYQVANKHTMKAAVLQEKGPEREAEANAEAQLGAGQVASGGIAVLCSTCVLCLIGLFSIVWGALGLAAAIEAGDDEKCSTTVQWYWIIFGINIATQCFVNVANQVLKQR